MNITLLGGGISSISLAYNLQKYKFIKKIYILEKNSQLGGLLRSYNFNNIKYDVGPHIIFSKHKNVLNKIKKILGSNKIKIKRSNKILYKKDIFIKYPFENDLAKLPKKDLNFALQKFLKNPHKNLKANNMNNFFLKNFGEGITKLYLEPYNTKIWKFPIKNLDTQMVNRIPKPPREDVIKSASGLKTEGYKHQLYFHYPKKGGIESLIKEYIKRFKKKISIICNADIKKIEYRNENFIINYNKNKQIITEKLFSSIPLNEFSKIFKSNNIIKKKSNKLKYNSIIIAMVNVKGKVAGENFAFMVPDKKIIFHRLSKLDFLGEKYSIKNTTTFLIEITFRKNTKIDKMKNNQLINKISCGLKKIGFINNKKDIISYSFKKFKYAYVIYDLHHRKNVDELLKYYAKKNIIMSGRWGTWEYLNSDQVINQSDIISKKFLEDLRQT